MQYPYLKRLPAFEYLAPKSIDEALVLLSRYGDQARLLAGGTDLILDMKRRKSVPQQLISLKNIEGLNYLNFDKSGGLRIGAVVKVHEIETAPAIKDGFPVLAQAAAALGSLQVRNLATVVGNLCTALPSADMAPALIALGAKLRIIGFKGERIVPVESFFLSPGKSVLEPLELVTEIQVPAPLPGSGMVYLKHMPRSAMDLAIVSVAAVITTDKDQCLEARICLGAAGPIPLRAAQAEAVLKGQRLEADLVRRAAETASQECNPRSSKRASAEYRREMVKVLTERAVNQIRENK